MSGNIKGLLKDFQVNEIHLTLHRTPHGPGWYLKPLCRDTETIKALGTSSRALSLPITDPVTHSPDTQHVVVEKDFWLETNFDEVGDNFHVL